MLKVIQDLLVPQVQIVQFQDLPDLLDLLDPLVQRAPLVLKAWLALQDLLVLHLLYPVQWDRLALKVRTRQYLDPLAQRRL